MASYFDLSARANSRRSPLTTGVAVVSAFAIALLGSVVLPSTATTAVAAPLAGTALFGPVTAPADSSFTGVGSIGNVTVPAGVCAVQATVIGGAGGSAMSTLVGANGAAASITATYSVVPGQVITGTVGGGGTNPNAAGTTVGAGGVPGGGDGGSSGAVSNVRHPGAGGGAYSELLIAGSRAILAGGGGGSGGGHSTTNQGIGGNAGLPTGAGAVSGAAGTNGRDLLTNGTYATNGGGAGGTGTAGGAGGVNANSTGANGQAGASLAGGAGGPDANPDAGGGGGGGLFGGGGGSSTAAYNQQVLGGTTAAQITGGGGGGGSSFVASTVPAPSGTFAVSGVSSSAVGKFTTATTGAGANGSIVLEWIECAYDLAVTKTANVVNTTVGSVVQWTVTVTNVGTAPMTQGDTVTLTDSLPGAGAKTVVSTTISGGSNAQLARGAVTCNTTNGSAMPGTIDCSRPYQAIGSAASGVRGIDPGESITIVYNQTIVASDSGALSNTATVTDRTTGDTNDSVTRTVNVVTGPTAANNASNGNTIGTAVAQTVLVNDTAGSGALVPSTLTLWNPGTNTAITSPYVVAGQGTWTVTTGTVGTSTVTFTPLATFKGNPTPVTYRITDANGLSATATVAVTYTATAADDESLNNVLGTTVDQSVLANDNGEFTTSTLAITGATAGQLVVANQGTWSVQAGGVIRFVPLASFKGDPTPIDYTVTTTAGASVGAQVRVTYVQTAADDESLNNVIGTTVNQSVLTNDQGVWNTSTLAITGATAGQLVVANQGTWSVQAGGVIRFVPLASFKGDPTPIAYTVATVDGDVVGANVRVTYLQTAANDENLNNVLGTTVNTNVLTNDNGDFDLATLRFSVETAPGEKFVPGQGTWTVQPGGVIRFVPLPTFFGDPSSVDYLVSTLSSGETVGANVRVTYVQTASNDSSLNNVLGSTVNQSVLANDHGVFDPATLTITGETSPGVKLVPGVGTWSVQAGGVIRFIPLITYLGDPAPIDYTVQTVDGETVGAQVLVTYVQTAADDESLNNTLGSTVNQTVLANDRGIFTESSLTITGQTAPGVKVVTGEGTWSVQTGGVIRFVPLATFDGDPTPIAYTVQTVDGETVGANVRVTYVQTAADDEDLDNALGTTVNQSVLVNDRGVFDVSTLAITGATAGELVVAGQGTWSVQPSGVIRFVPLSTFLGDPTPIAYTVDTVDGETVGANVRVTYVQSAVDDEDLDNVLGSTVDQTVLVNDLGVFTASTLAITGATAGELVVANQGTWSVQPGGVIRFVPLSTFLGNPTPISYTVDTVDGETVGADVRVTYVQSAVNDEDLDNVLGTTVDQSVLTNDLGTFVASTLRIVNETASGVKVVAGEGTWSVQPGGIIRFVPLSTFKGDPSVIRYEVDTTSGATVSAQVRVTYLQVAEDDEDLDNVLGTTVDQSVLVNDEGVFAPATLRIVGETAPGVKVVANQGTWSVQPGGIIRFEPLPTYFGDPTPIDYRVDTVDGDTVSASVVVTYVQTAADDEDLNNVLGSTVDQSVLVNDKGIFDPTTLEIVGATAGVLVVANEGTWSVETGGVIRFAPLASFLGDPAPIAYTVDTVNGDTVGADVRVGYVQIAIDDEDLDNVLGSTVDQTVLVNDRGVFDPATLSIYGATAGQLVVTGEGTWSVRAGGVIRFVPFASFLGDPAPISYTVDTVDGETVGADVRVTYVQSAVDDEDLNNVIGSTVDQTVLENDRGVFDAATLEITGATAGELVVTGEGIWSVQSGGVIRFVPFASFLGDPAPISYTVDTVDGETVGADVRVTYVQSAVNDQSLNNTLGASVDQSVLANDRGVFDAATLTIVGATGGSLIVAGEGEWTVQAGGVIRFTPLVTFFGNPTDIEYEVETVDGELLSASVRVTYVQTAADDEDLDNVLGSTVNVSVLTNDFGIFDEATLAIVGGTAGELVVPGEGTWSVQSGGVIRFVPIATFFGDPTPIDYEIDTVDGRTVGAEVRVTYVQTAADDEDLDNVLGSTVNVSVLTNDRGVFDSTTLEITGGTAGELVVAGEGTWSVQSGGVIRFVPLSTFLGDPAPISYTVETVDGDVVGADVLVTYVQSAVDDEDLDNVLGSTVDQSVLVNDRGVIDAATLTIVGATAGELVVAGEGTWTVQPGGVIRFVPLVTFLGDPAPISYEVETVDGELLSADVVVTYLQVAVDDTNLLNPIGSTVNTTVVANDLGIWDLTTVKIVGETAPGEKLVPGEGTWTVQANGVIRFVPLSTFLVDPMPIRYTVDTVDGDTAEAELLVTFVPDAIDDVVNGAKLGDTIPVDVLANDRGDMDASSVRIIDPVTNLPVTTLVVAGQGTWTVDTTTGVISFDPESGFVGNPTPIAYEVTDSTGDTVSATVTIAFTPEASTDWSTGNIEGRPVTVDVIGNDLGNLDPTSVRIVDPNSGALVTTMFVPGEGTWTVNTTTGAITFTPLSDFKGDPTPPTYQVSDMAGAVTTAQINITYVHPTAGLVVTGADLVPALSIAFLLLLIGALAMVISRRRLAKD